MIRVIFSIIFLIGAGGVYYFLTDPIINNPRSVDPTTQNVVGGIKVLQAEKEALITAIENIQKLSGRAQELEATYRTIDENQIKRLDVFLPDSVDDIQLIVDVDTIAQKSGMQIKDVRVNTDPDRGSRANTRNTQIATTSTFDKPQIAKVGLSFTAIGTYSQLRSLLSDLSLSLRVLDITKVSVVTPAVSNATTTLGASQLQYQVELVTYWLK